MKNIKTYIHKESYAETSDEVGFVLNLDQLTLFPTASGSWMNVKETCEKHNAILYQPDNENAFKMIHNKYGKVSLHIGMYLKDGTWTDCKGLDVSKFFWAIGEPKTGTCGAVTTSSKMMASMCNYFIRIGLCIY